MVKNRGSGGATRDAFCRVCVRCPGIGEAREAICQAVSGLSFWYQPMSLIRVTFGPPAWAAASYAYGQSLVKTAGEPTVAYNLSGVLHLSGSGWLMLSVPNALVHGVFAAMNEPGAELPPGPDNGPMSAHISVMRPEEIEMIGGPSKITERGKQYRYSLGRLTTVEPEGWSEVSRVWMLTVHSPELQAFRRSYGLSGLPNDGKFAFHITCAVKRKGVLGRNDTRKGALSPGT